jgi:hypothetical protein
MNSNVFLRLNYEQDEVISAQRMRFLHSNRLKLLTVLSILGTIALGLQQAWLWFREGVVPATWYTPIYLPLIFGGVFVVAYFLAPSMDFKVNPQWQNAFDLYLEADAFRITPIGKLQGFEKAWKEVKQVLENDKVYIWFFNSEQEFIIMPKRVLKAQESLVQDKLTRQAKR